MAEAYSVCFCPDVAAHIQRLGASQRDNQQRRGSYERESGFLFSQLGKFKASTRTLYDSGWQCRQADARAKGECGKYVGRGRFAEKGGGQQVASAFPCSSDNEKIKAIYGNYGFWSWLRYWYLDSADFVTLMLLDKGYYDYDYSEPKEAHKTAIKKKSDKEVSATLARFGFNTKLRSRKKSLTAEEMQRIAMEEQNEKL